MLIEVFELEDIDRLIAGLKKLFPNIKKSKELIENIERSTGSLFSSGWYRVGMVSRLRPTLSVSESTIDPTLPANIDYVSIWIYGITPSVTAIAFTFGLADENTANLVKRHNRHYLPDTEFKKLFPWGPLGGGHSENAVEAVMQRSILNYMMGIREECEKWISQYFKGRLLDAARNKEPSLSAIEIFALTDVPDDSHEKLRDWKKQTSGWSHAFGISIDDTSNFMALQDNLWVVASLRGHGCLWTCG